MYHLYQLYLTTIRGQRRLASWANMRVDRVLMAESIASVLLVEDDVPLATLVAKVLRREGFAPTLVHRGDEVVAAVQRHNPDVVILDIMLEGGDGFTICRKLRTLYAGAILMLTARGETVDQVLGLELGADDYLVKPVEPPVLIAHIRALLRRAGPRTPRELRYQSLRILLDERQAYVGAEPVALTSAEYELLEYLAVRSGEVVHRTELYTALKGVRYDGFDRSLDLRISRVRAALRKASPALDPIRTVHGRGYLFRTT